MSFTQVPPNSTGNKIDTVTVVDGADTVHRQVVIVKEDPAGTDPSSRMMGMQEMMEYYLSAILEKLPRLDSTDRMLVTLAEVITPTYQSGVYNSTTGAATAYINTPWDTSRMAANGLYQQIIIS